MTAARKSVTTTRLTPRQRLTRGLAYMAVGPLDITRGAVGLGWHGAQSAATRVRHRYEDGGLADRLSAAEETIGKDLAANLPHTFVQPGKPKHRKLPLLIAAGMVAIAAGGIAFSIVRRSMQPEPSPRPPSVDVEPKP